jgi:hypothetical protein
VINPIFILRERARSMKPRLKVVPGTIYWACHVRGLDADYHEYRGYGLTPSEAYYAWALRTQRVLEREYMGGDGPSVASTKGLT